MNQYVGVDYTLVDVV